MEIRCPACRKVNSLSDLCERCGCDLSVLKKIQQAALTEFHAGVRELKKGAGEGALNHAEISWRLKKNNNAAKLGFSACILLKEFNEAQTWYNRAVKFPR